MQIDNIYRLHNDTQITVYFTLDNELDELSMVNLALIKTILYEMYFIDLTKYFIEFEKVGEIQYKLKRSY